MGNQVVNRSKQLKNLATRLIAKVGRPVVWRLSDLARESLKQPGSWRCLELVYENKPRKLLDRYFLGSRSARATRNRLQIFQEEILQGILQYSYDYNPVRIISFGSGPGHEILDRPEIFQKNISVEATFFDRDGSALEQGRLIADRHGLDGSINFIQGNVLRLKPEMPEYNIGIVSGLIDYFDFDTAVSVLKTVNAHLQPGGMVLLANMCRHRLASTMNILGNWKLEYREPAELEEILNQSGFINNEVWREPEGIFCLGKAYKTP